MFKPEFYRGPRLRGALKATAWGLAFLALWTILYVGLGGFVVLWLATTAAILLGSICALVVGVATYVRERDLVVLSRRGAFLAALSAFPFVVLKTPDVQLHLSRGAAQEISSALAAHRATEGGCPDRLADLVPEYLESVPRSWWGPAFRGRFGYEYYRGDPEKGLEPDCAVWLPRLALETCYWVSDARVDSGGRWYCDD